MGRADGGVSIGENEWSWDEPGDVRSHDDEKGGEGKSDIGKELRLDGIESEHE